MLPAASYASFAMLLTASYALYAAGIAAAYASLAAAPAALANFQPCEYGFATIFIAAVPAALSHSFTKVDSPPTPGTGISLCSSTVNTTRATTRADTFQLRRMKLTSRRIMPGRLAWPSCASTAATSLAAATISGVFSWRTRCMLSTSPGVNSSSALTTVRRLASEGSSRHAMTRCCVTYILLNRLVASRTA